MSARRSNRKKASTPVPVAKPKAADKPELRKVPDLEEKVDHLSITNRQLKRKVFDLYTIFEISRNFNAVLDYELLLETFIFTCLGQLGSLKGAIFLRRHIHASRFYLVRTKGSGHLPQPEDFFRDDTQLAKYLTKLNRPVFVRELSEEMVPPDEMEILKGFSKGVIVPLIHQTHLTGLFVLADKISEKDFSPDDMEFLSALGNQISVAIENARLYEAEKLAIEQLRAAQQQLVQTERLAALGEMSAKIAHEVNNPLGIIKNYVLLLKREGKGRKAIEEYSEIVSQEIDRIANIVGQMREFQRPVTMEFNPVNVREVLENTLELTERQLKSSSIIVVRRFEDTNRRVNGNGDSLKQVFLNLIVNSRTAMESGGNLIIDLKRCDDKLQILFRDTGDGIPPDIVPRIFEPFFTTKGDKGTGLGLSVCHGIIRSHGGSISYKDSDPGGYFEILLPLLD